MAASAVEFLLSFPKGDAAEWTAGGFLVGCSVALLLGVVTGDRDRLGRFMLILLGAMLVSLPFLRIAMGGADWSDLWAIVRFVPIMLDIMLFAGGLFGIAAGLRLKVRGLQTSPLSVRQTTAVPAE